MKKVGLVSGVIFAMVLLFGGCATLDRLLPKDLQETKTAIEQARLSGADKKCPEEYKQVVAMWNEAMEIYRACRTQEAIAKASAAREKARTLCEVRKDTDGDGVFDDMDQCPDTPKGVKVDQKGCPLDSDGDGVFDYVDQCLDTPKGVKVDEKGCPLDSDGDGVFDFMDQCPDTPKGVKVDEKGCPLDSDGDGVPDYLDQCSDTPKGAKVDTKGCPLDSDGDGVYDYLDKCPGTPKGAKVNEMGCWVLEGVLFDTSKRDIKSPSFPILDEAVDVLRKNPDLKLQIQGHTDSRGKSKYNQRLSEKRAEAVMDYMVKKGIARERLSFIGYGSTRPVASNLTPEGQAKNRRVELNPVH